MAHFFKKPLDYFNYLRVLIFIPLQEIVHRNANTKEMSI